MKSPLICCLLACCCLASAAEVSHASRYQVTDIGFTVANSISDAGQAVGYNQSSSISHGYTWQSGTGTGLGTLGGMQSWARKANSYGAVVGSSYTSAGQEHAFIYQNGTMNELATLTGYAQYEALSINDSGVAVGWGRQRYNDGTWMAAIWQNGTISSISGTGSDGEAFDINNHGDIVGATGGHGFLWRNGQITTLPTFGGSFSVAYAVNQSDAVVGRASTSSGGSHAFLWQNGTMTDLGQLYNAGSTALDINSSNQIIGFSPAPGGVGDHAFLWENGKMTDLNSLIPANSGWTLVNACGINDAGEIVGWGYKGSATRAFLLTVPEPSPLLVLLSQLAGLGYLSVRRRR